MLNFDPHRWIAEREGQSVASVATVAGTSVKTENANPAEPPATLATVATLPEARDVQRTLDGWCGAFNGLSPLRPAPVFTMGRWQTLYDCTQWWLENFARRAAWEGWSTGDVFGIRPGYPTRGGLIDQLGDNRSLVMADGGARWRSWGIMSSYAAGCSPHLEPFWKGQ